MSTAKLNWDFDAQQIRFRLEGADGTHLPVDRWGIYDVQIGRGRGSVGHLVALAEDEAANVENGTVVCLAHSQIAELDGVQAERLGLPPVAPYRLELRGSGLLSSRDFRFQHRLITFEGRPVLGAKRTGAFISAGSRTFTLLDPIYSLVTGMEAFNATPESDLDRRFLQWSRLQELLPADAKVDQHLRSMNIVRADAFTLDYTEDGQVHPVLLAHTRKLSEAESEYEQATESLAPEAQRDFADRFHRLPRAQARYTLSGSWYVVLGGPLRRVLEVVRDYQDRPPEERRAFLGNPVGILKERLGDELEEKALEATFEETPAYLSARVKGLGEWEPKVCAYVVRGRQQWLPPEEFLLGVPVGGKICEVPVKDVPAVIASVQAALDRGDPEVEYNGQRLPATEETLEALLRLGGKRERQTTVAETEQPERPTNLIPQIIDNLEELGFETRVRATRGDMGGIPALLRHVDLYDHQIDGLRWLQSHWAAGSAGALLADDMGLGKTLQTLGFLAWLQEQMESGAQRRKTFLVVAPTGLLKNWEDEAAMHLAEPGLGRLVRAYGGELRGLSAQTHREQLRSLTDPDWVLTTYETLRDRVQLFIGVEWGVVVFDEAQKIKNPTSRMAEMAKAIKGDFVVALTGTPVENRLAELWSILDTTNPGLLGSLKEFHNTYEKPAETTPEAAAPLAAKLKAETTPPVMLRRLKEDHLRGLPEKTQRVVEKEMPSRQADAYAAAVASAAPAAPRPGAMLETLHALRRLSLLGGPLGPEGLTDDDVAGSARLIATFEILDELHRGGEKALVFVEFLDLQEALIPYIQRRYGLGRPPLRISGGVSGVKRKQRVDEFQRGEPGAFAAMLLSPKAGGVGLTLTAANHVIHLTRWWNPAVEDQCTDRVYRIGQTRPVSVHVPMAIHPQFGEHSFDKNLHVLLGRKRLLSRAVLTPPTASQEDIESLFRDSVRYESG